MEPPSVRVQESNVVLPRGEVPMSDEDAESDCSMPIEDGTAAEAPAGAPDLNIPDDGSSHSIS